MTARKFISRNLTGEGYLDLQPASTDLSDATTVGEALIGLTNPSAVSFLRANADNSVDALSASDFRTAIGCEVPLTFGSGLTRTANAVANDLITGKAGGQTIYGGTATTEGLILRANSADLTTGTVSVPGTKAAASATDGAFTVAGGIGTNHLYATRLTVNTSGALSINTFTPATAVSGLNLFIGDGGQSSAVGTHTYEGSGLIGIGSGALLANTTGYNSIAIGKSAAGSNTTGANIIAVGNFAAGLNVVGSGVIAIGGTAAYNSTAGNIIAIGGTAAYANTTGLYKTVIGQQACRYDTTGYGIVGVGYRVFYNLNITANDGTGMNTAVGHLTGGGIVTGVNNTILGANVTGLAAGLSNNIILATGDGTIRAQFDGTNWTLPSGNLSLTSGVYKVNATQVVGAQVASIGFNAKSDSAKIADLIAILRAHGLAGPDA
jgi:hypothetical protein